MSHSSRACSRSTPNNKHVSISPEIPGRQQSDHLFKYTISHRRIFLIWTLDSHSWTCSWPAHPKYSTLICLVCYLTWHVCSCQHDWQWQHEPNMTWRPNAHRMTAHKQHRFGSRCQQFSKYRRHHLNSEVSFSRRNVHLGTDLSSGP